MRSIFIALICSLLLVAPVRAEEPAPTLEKQTSSPDIQSQLIASGFLDNQIGRGSRAEVLAAVEAFRLAHALPGAKTEPLTAAELELLKGAKEALDKLANFQTIKNPKNGLN